MKLYKRKPMRWKKVDDGEVYQCSNYRITLQEDPVNGDYYFLHLDFAYCSFHLNVKEAKAAARAHLDRLTEAFFEEVEG